MQTRPRKASLITTMSRLIAMSQHHTLSRTMRESLSSPRFPYFQELHLDLALAMFLTTSEARRLTIMLISNKVSRACVRLWKKMKGRNLLAQCLKKSSSTEEDPHLLRHRVTRMLPLRCHQLANLKTEVLNATSLRCGPFLPMTFRTHRDKRRHLSGRHHTSALHHLGDSIPPYSRSQCETTQWQAVARVLLVRPNSLVAPQPETSWTALLEESARSA